MKKEGLKLPTPSELQDRHVEAARIQKENVYDRKKIETLSRRRRQDLEDLRTIPNIAKARLKAQFELSHFQGLRKETENSLFENEDDLRAAKKRLEDIGKEIERRAELSTPSPFPSLSLSLSLSKQNKKTQTKKEERKHRQI